MEERIPLIRSKRWPGPNPPGKILAIRLQAMGDLVITLPYLQHLRNTLPQTTVLDLLTREEVDDIPRTLELFNRVISVGGGRRRSAQWLHGLRLLPGILSRNYDVVIDLQNNSLSRFFRRSVMPKAWAEFDKFSPLAAGERTRLTIQAAGLSIPVADTRFILRNRDEGSSILKQKGWDGQGRVLVLNPAGAFVTRNWPIENYLAFAERWLDAFPQTQFLVMGLDSMRDKALELEKRLGRKLINLVGKTSAAQVFSILQQASLVISEDSGLMHMSWVSGIPTLAMFGSTRSDWSRPLGEHTLLLDSSDLPCGNCMQEVCKYGDTHCLARYSPEWVFQQSLRLVK